MSTWIFLRGLTRDSRHWGDFPALFRSANADADVVTLDLPGNGRLNSLRSPASIAAMTEHCRADVLAQGLRPPYYLLALSLGAMAAIDWAARHPSELRGAVLINTSLRPFSPFFHRLRPQSYLALVRLSLLAGSPEATEAAILKLTSRRLSDAQAILSSWINYRREHPVSRLNALRQMVAAGRFCGPVEKPSPPLLILASAKDGLVNPRCSRGLALRWRTAYAEHPQAGHDLPLDDGDWVAQQVRHWMQDA